LRPKKNACQHSLISFAAKGVICGLRVEICPPAFKAMAIAVEVRESDKLG